MKKSLMFLALLLSCSILVCSCNTEMDPTSFNNLSSSAESGNSEQISSIGADDSSLSDLSETDISDGSSDSMSQSENISTVISNSNVSTASGNIDYSGDSYKYIDLGAMQMKAFPSDNLYDWGFSTIKDGDIYKMWWVRPSLYDSIWYAESKDLKNWYNEKRVLTISSPIVKDYEWLKWMVARPSVLKVNGTYYMYFEGPATNEIENGSNVETDNNVFLATSKDGFNWSFYPSNDNPQPIVKEPEELMRKRYYGVGQPSAFYKDGTFYLYYCYVLNGVNQLMVATSKDGINYGDPAKHINLGMINGAGVKYNAVTNKYLMIYNYKADSSEYGNYYIMESDNPLKWPYKTLKEASKSNMEVTSNPGFQYAFPDFVTNAQGHITTESIYITYMQGKISKTSDWRAEYRTWDGHISAINPIEFAKKDIVLPNGKISNSTNLNVYKDTPVVLSKQVSSANYTSASPKIDGNKDTIYDSSPEILIKRAIYDWGSNLTSTNGKARVLWDESNLYVYVDVRDTKISYGYRGSLSDMWRRDSVDIVIDVPNDHSTSPSLWGPKQYLLSVCANGEFMVKAANDVEITDEFEGIQKAVKIISGGYTVEIKLPWHNLVKSQIVRNKVIGFDIQINDDMGANNREAMVVWNDFSGNAFRYTDVLGDLKLVR